MTQVAAELLEEARALRRAAERLERRAAELVAHARSEAPPEPEAEPVSDTDRALAKRLARKHGFFVRASRR